MVCAGFYLFLHPAKPEFVAHIAGQNIHDARVASPMRHDHVCLDFSAVEGMPGVREQLVYAAGHPTLGSRVLFSSASPFVPFADALQIYMDLGLMQETLQHVLYDNAAALLS